MARVEVRRHLDTEEIEALSALVDRANVADGQAPLGEEPRSELARGGGPGFAGLLAWDARRRRPLAYAHLTGAAGKRTLELVVDPGHRVEGAPVGREVLAQAIELVRSEGGGEVSLWLRGQDQDYGAEALGLALTRELLQLRRSLPLPLDLVADPGPLEVRPFEPGRDEKPWLEVNNRAFAWHPEQAGWDLETLESREAQGWFDPSGFLLHERDGRLAGFCWTKVHAHEDPPLGEIYVVAVDPDFQGLGLGRALTVAGLASLAGRGLRHGMLYVDWTNTAARALYDALGFTLHHVDRVYVGQVGRDP